MCTIVDSVCLGVTQASMSSGTISRGSVWWPCIVDQYCYCYCYCYMVQYMHMDMAQKDVGLPLHYAASVQIEPAPPALQTSMPS